MSGLAGLMAVAVAQWNCRERPCGTELSRKADIGAR